MKRFLPSIIVASFCIMLVASASPAAKPGAELDGYRWNFPTDDPMPAKPRKGAVCKSALVKGDPNTTDNFTENRNFGGVKGKRYKVTLRFRGVVEPMMYKGGVKDGEYFYIGGQANSGGYNTYKLEISSPKSHYYLNRRDRVGHDIFTIDYTKTIEIDGGATLTMSGDGQNGKMIANFKLLTIPGVQEKPTYGQFAQVNVIDVKETTAADKGESDWTPTKKAISDVPKAKGLAVSGRTMEIFQHGVKKEWGYAKPQTDSFVVVHPKAKRTNAPLYVVLHSAGHDVWSCIRCTSKVGNHDIYHSPDDFYALYLDCRANKGDWWWGGMFARDKNLTKKNSGPDPMPVERRAIDTVKWAIKTYKIDPNRVYLCGNSMGGSGTLGIGIRNGDIFAAIKANVPAGIEHVSNRMGFPPYSLPKNVKLPDPPVVIDYSGQNDGWSFGHDRFVKAMNDRKYSLYFYWGPFGHANNHAAIMKVNDLINSFDWLGVKKNEAYAVFTNASCNSKLPWPDNLKEKAPGQVNAFFRWKNIADTTDKLEMSIFLVSPKDLKTSFEIPKTASADISLRRVQNLKVKPGETFKWTFGSAKGSVKADQAGIITIKGLKISPERVTLTVNR
jgi:predicted esterase